MPKKQNKDVNKNRFTNNAVNENNNNNNNKQYRTPKSGSVA